MNLLETKPIACQGNPPTSMFPPVNLINWDDQQLGIWPPGVVYPPVDTTNSVNQPMKEFVYNPNTIFPNSRIFSWYYYLTGYQPLDRNLRPIGPFRPTLPLWPNGNWRPPFLNGPRRGEINPVRIGDYAYGSEGSFWEDESESDDGDDTLALLDSSDYMGADGSYGGSYSSGSGGTTGGGGGGGGTRPTNGSGQPWIMTPGWYEAQTKAGPPSY